MIKNRLLLLLIITITFSICSCTSKYSNLKSQITSEPIDSWVLNSMDSVGNYLKFDFSNSVSLSMAKGEFEHFQVVIKTKSENSVLSIEQISKNSPLEFSTRSIESFEGVEDVLVPCQTIIARDSIVKLWITYRTDATDKAGRYEDIIRIFNGEESTLLTVTIDLFDCLIPEIPTIPSLFGICPERMGIDSLSQEEQIASKQEVSDLLLDYRICPYFSSWVKGSMRVENSSSPYPIDDPRTWEYLKDPRFVRFALPYHALSDDQLKAMLTKANEENLIDNALLYVWDEPTLLSEYDKIGEYADRIHRYAPKAQIITTYYRGPKDGDRVDDLFATFEYLRGATSIYCTGVWSLRDSEERADSCRNFVNKNEEWWTYVCMADVPGLAYSSSNIQNRATLWRSYKEQSTGFLYWVVNSFDSVDPLISRKNLPLGDGELVYPGNTFGHDKSVVSMRLERWRDGAEDYELLKLLENKSGRSEALKLLDMVYTNPLEQSSKSSNVLEFKRKLLNTITTNIP